MKTLIQNHVALIFKILALYTLLSNNAIALILTLQTGETESLEPGDDGDVQAGQIWPDQRFVDREEGTIVDNATGLMWLKDADCATEIISSALAPHQASAFTFINALNNQTIHCANYDDTYSDWRVPSVKEYASLMRAGLTDQTIANWLTVPKDQSPGITQSNLVSNPIWTSTTSAENSDYAWIINFDTGGTQTVHKTDNSFPAYIFSAVRNAENFPKPKVLPTFAPNDFSNLEATFLPSPRFVSFDNGTVIDKLTGLRWIADANCTTTLGHDWYSAVASTIVTGLESNAPFTNGCIDYIPPTNDEPDIEWRLSNLNELQTLLNYGEFNPSIDFDNPFSIQTTQPFWTSSSSNGANYLSHAWAIDFKNGNIIAALDKSFQAYSWPVSGPIQFADIASSVSTLEFSRLFTNTETSKQDVALINTGELPLTIESLEITGTQFSIETTECEATELQPEESCHNTIRFSPTVAGTINASLTVTSDALGLEIFHVPLLGTGLSASEENSNKKCFIATAAYGSYLDEEVVVLRNFRDEFLLSSKFGQWIVKNYYIYSPPLANTIENNDGLRLVVRIILVPLVYSLKYPLFTILFVMGLILFFVIRQTHRKHKYETFCRIMRTK